MGARIAAGVLALASVAAVAAGLRPVDAPEPAAGRAIPQVAVWSARRLPLALADAVGAAKLPVRLHDVLDEADACFVMREGEALTFSLDPAEPKIPASTQKLLTGAAALEVFGPDHRFRTTVVAPSAPSGGTVAHLYLVGGADPALMVSSYKASLEEDPLTTGAPFTSLEDLANQVVAAGVREVRGGVTGDASRHSGAPTVPTWRSAYITDHDISFLSALTVNDGWSEWEPSKVTAPDPAANAAAELARLLSDRGVVVGGGASSGQAPAGARDIASVQSPPLGDLVTAMIRESDNLTAELLVREVGLARQGEGTTEAGTRALVEVLRELQIDVSGVALVDGSGLDRGNRATCGSALGALDLRRQEKFTALDAGLAVAGETGTLHRRFEGTGVEGRLRAKTGSLRDVVGLVGVLEDRDGGRPDLSFALMATGTSLNGADLQNRIAETLDAYPFPAADPAVLGPPPARARG